jgi:uncharacterized membrane protein
MKLERTNKKKDVATVEKKSPIRYHLQISIEKKSNPKRFCPQAKTSAGLVIFTARSFR